MEYLSHSRNVHLVAVVRARKGLLVLVVLLAPVFGVPKRGRFRVALRPLKLAENFS